uniref:Protein kinase domain-containing protein n=1 Tax=viral metagenome TaxID=1070528 RepID=A0A6C0EXN4_9ZZZZ
MKIKKTITPNTNLLQQYDGGAPFTSGGYGCLFKPAIQCEDSETPKNYVSKLLETGNAIREYEYISRIKQKLEHIPADIKKYLLIDNIKICKPKEFTEEDKKNIDKTCDHIISDIKDTATHKPINSTTINNNLDKFKIINMPELGISMNDFIKKTKLSSLNIIKLNNIIIEYVSKIMPSINKNGVIHGDIKSANILFNLNDTELPTVIDWGLSYTIPSDKTKFPNALYKLSVQYQHPFSTFLFSKDILEKYKSFLKTLQLGNVKISRDSLRVFALSNYFIFLQNHENHFKILLGIFITGYKGDMLQHISDKESNIIDELISNNILMNYIIEYIVDVLMTYTINSRLELGKYFHEVYSMNIDIWGIMSIYFELIHHEHGKYYMTNNEYKIFINKIMNILIDNIFKNGDKKIDIPKLVDDINDLNKFLTDIHHRAAHIHRVSKIVGKHEHDGVIDIKKKGIANKLSANLLFYDDIEKHVKHIKHAHPSHLKTKKSSKKHTIKSYGQITTSFKNHEPVVVKGGRGQRRRRGRKISNKYGHHIRGRGRGGYRIKNKTRKLKH